MKTSFNIQIIITCLFLGSFTYGQNTITLKNPSFEDTPRAGTNKSKPVKDWIDCGKLSFPYATAPDIHPAGLWENTLLPSEGNTYIGMVVREDESWESISQILSTPLRDRSCYQISLEIAQSTNYWSASRLTNTSTKFNFTQPTVLRIWGGTTYCEKAELLAESPAISNSDWKTYTFKLQPKYDYRFLVFEAFYKTPILEAYNGHILIDNVSDIIKIECDKNIIPIKEFKRILVQKEILVINEPAPIKKKKNLTQYKSSKKSNNNPKTYQKEIKLAQKKKSNFSNIDMAKLKKGHIINLEKVYFNADTSSVDDKSLKVLDDLYLFLINNQKLTIEVGGHTNSTPSNRYCNKLSTERAKIVADYLIHKGISKDRISYKGYGKTEPIATNKSIAGRRRNQRVEIKIINVK